MPCDTLLKEADSIWYEVSSSTQHFFSAFSYSSSLKKREKKIIKHAFDQPITSVTQDVPHCGKSLLPEGRSLRHQIEAGNILRCMEDDEPYKEHECSFKNTQRIIVISSSHKASITAVIKTNKKKFKKLLRSPPSGKSREKEIRQ